MNWIKGKPTEDGWYWVWTGMIWQMVYLHMGELTVGLGGTVYMENITQYQRIEKPEAPGDE